jgi:hypothetical protein
MDRLLQALKQLLSDVPALSLRRYDAGNEESAVDVFLIEPLAPMMLPLRFRKPARPYAAEVIWVSQGHEVVEAEPRHVAMLYCRS